MPTLPSRPLIPHTQATCPYCTTQLEFPTPVASNDHIDVECFKCRKVFAPQATQAPPPPSRKTRGRKIGTQEQPLETKYYDILSVPVTATPDEIKKAYRRLAIKLHPDKNRDDPNADERFKEIAIAYQTLSDPVLRKKYNEFGPKESAPEGGYMDPEEIFGTIFGGEKFIPIFGHISLARDMKTALQEDDEEPETGPPGQKKILSPEEKAKKLQKEQTVLAQKTKEREERVAELVKTLERKLSIFSESATGANDADVRRSWQQICQIEAEELRGESFGVELLHAIGFVYSSKAKHFLASQQLFGVGGWIQGVQNRYHVFSETVGTVRAALEVKQVFEQLAQAEKGGVTPEQRKKLEEQAAEKGMQALFKGAKLEIESVLRETCDRVLNPESGPLVSQDKLVLRATALEILGEAFMAAQKDAPSILESDYVRVETQSSKARNSGTYSR